MYLVKFNQCEACLMESTRTISGIMDGHVMTDIFKPSNHISAFRIISIGISGDDNPPPRRVMSFTQEQGSHWNRVNSRP